MKSKICKTCNVEYFQLNFKKYCSRKCYEIRPNGFTSGGSVILQCLQCKQDVLKFKSEIQKNPDKVFCNSTCSSNYDWKTRHKSDSRKSYLCKICNKNFLRYSCDIHSQNIFCSASCASKHTSQFTKRREKSNLELFILQKLKENFPYLRILTGDREQCSGLELDFYFPDLNTAIEINGPIHYKSIYGEKYLSSMQERDLRKSEICKNKNIDLIYIKNDKKFKNEIGNFIWLMEFKPIILRKVPFCIPLSESETEFEINSR